MLSTKQRIQQSTPVQSVDLPQGMGTVTLYRYGKHHWIHRHAARGRVDNAVNNYELVFEDGSSRLKPLDEPHGKEIIERLKRGVAYSSVFIFYKDEKRKYTLPLERSKQEHQYTSTGIKFWRHSEQMFEYRDGKPGSVISTHISPEGSCNLRCPYCSVTYRDTHSRIPLDTIKKYVTDLKTRGLRAVILTGGGEPTAYKYFNELVTWLHDEQRLSVALITNGTLTRRIQPEVWKMFSWIRVSINVFDGWETKIALPLEHIDPDKTTVGCSMVYTAEHESTDETTDRIELLRKVSAVADNVGAKYIRLLPNCLLEQEDLVAQHESLDHTLAHIDDPRFFHQYKVHGTPRASVCHQSYFRPYLSEELHMGRPGTVYPCDSVVLNDSYQHFAKEYQLCHASEILDYLDRKIKPQFDPRERCAGCVFTENVDMLQDWVDGRVNRFAEFEQPLKHEEFV